MAEDVATYLYTPPITPAEAVKLAAKAVRISYEQNGASESTLSLVRKYVDAVIQGGYQDLLNDCRNRARSHYGPGRTAWRTEAPGPGPVIDG